MRFRIPQFALNLLKYCICFQVSIPQDHKHFVFGPYSLSIVLITISAGLLAGMFSGILTIARWVFLVAKASQYIPVVYLSLLRQNTSGLSTAMLAIGLWEVVLQIGRNALVLLSCSMSSFDLVAQVVTSTVASFVSFIVLVVSLLQCFWYNGSDQNPHRVALYVVVLSSALILVLSWWWSGWNMTVSGVVGSVTQCSHRQSSLLFAIHIATAVVSVVKYWPQIYFTFSIKAYAGLDIGFMLLNLCTEICSFIIVYPLTTSSSWDDVISCLQYALLLYCDTILLYQAYWFRASPTTQLLRSLSTRTNGQQSEEDVSEDEFEFAALSPAQSMRNDVEANRSARSSATRSARGISSRSAKPFSMDNYFQVHAEDNLIERYKALYEEKPPETVTPLFAEDLRRRQEEYNALLSPEVIAAAGDEEEEAFDGLFVSAPSTGERSKSQATARSRKLLNESSDVHETSADVDGDEGSAGDDHSVDVEDLFLNDEELNQISGAFGSVLYAGELTTSAVPQSQTKKLGGKAQSEKTNAELKWKCSVCNAINSMESSVCKECQCAITPADQEYEDDEDEENFFHSAGSIVQHVSYGESVPNEEIVGTGYSPYMVTTATDHDNLYTYAIPEGEEYDDDEYNA